MNNKTMVVICALCILILGGIALFYESNHIMAAKVTYEPLQKVKIGYRPQLFYLPAYVAKAEGYYRAQGLDAELVSFESTNQLVDAILNGNIDAGVGGVNILVPLTIEDKSPGQLKIFDLTYFHKEFDALLVAKNSSITKVSDLKGKTISTLPGTAANFWMKSMLEKENLTGQVKVVETNPSQQLAALASGSVDAIYVLEPLATTGIEKGIARVLVESPISTYFMDNMLFDTSVFSTKFVNEHPDTAKKIIAAVDEAIESINADPVKARRYYPEFSPVDNATAEKLPVTEYVTSDSMNATALQVVADKFAETGAIKKVEVGPMLYR